MVDDEPGRLLAYEAVLSGLGVECVKAESGRQALEKFAARTFAAALLDVRMPDLDGFEVARRMRQHPVHGGTPILFLTAADISELELLQGYELGAIDYITMPIASEVLRSKVAVLVALHQRRTELESLNQQLEAARRELESAHARELAARESQLEALFEHPSDMTVVVRAQRDATGTIRDWIYLKANRNALALLQRPAEQVLGKRLSNRVPSQALLNSGSQARSVRTMALSVVRSLRMQAMRAILGSLPAASRRA
jgi:DNA-binding response OmpR family regulator